MPQTLKDELAQTVFLAKSKSCQSIVCLIERNVTKMKLFTFARKFLLVFVGEHFLLCTYEERVGCAKLGVSFFSPLVV